MMINTKEIFRLTLSTDAQGIAEMILHPGYSHMHRLERPERQHYEQSKTLNYYKMTLTGE